MPAFPWLMCFHRAKIFLAPFCAAFFLILSPAQGDSGTVDPPFWKISNGTSVAYILGTVHLLDSEAAWYTDEIAARLEQADALMLEISPEEQTSAALQQEIMRAGVFTDGRSLPQALDPDTYAALQETLGNMGFPETAFDPFKPWMAAIVLEVQMLMELGYSPQYGVDYVLGQHAERTGMEILALERGADQLRALDGMSEEAQAAMLRLILADSPRFEAMVRDLRDAWLSGDTDYLADEIIAEARRESPVLFERLFAVRNRNWVPKIAALMAEDGVYFIAVGAGHLVGKDNVLMLLQAEGYTVQRQ